MGNPGKWTKRISARILAATLLVPGMAAMLLMPGMPAYAVEATAEQQLAAAENVVANAIRLEIRSTNEYTTYASEEFTIHLEQEEAGTDAESGEPTNESRVTPGDVTITVSQDLAASADNIKTVQTGVDSYWTRTAYADLDLSGFEAPGIYTYLVTETQHNGKAASSTNAGNNSLAIWTNSQAQYRLRVYVEDLGSDREYARTVTIEMLTDQSGTSLGDETQKATSLAFHNSVTAPTFALTKFVEGSEDPRGISQGYPFYVTCKDSSVKTLQYLIKDGDQPVDLTRIYEISNKSYQWIYLKKGQTAIFINMPAGSQVSKVQEAKNSNNNAAYGAPDLGVTKIKTSLYYNGVRDAKKSADGSKTFSSENSASNLDVLQTGTKLDWTNVCGKEAIATGIVTSIAPYVTLVVLAGAAVAVYIIIKQRMR